MGTMATNLAADETRFIGRSDDLGRLGALTEQGDRLISVMGPAGMGKTRLLRRFGALQASDENPTYRRVWFCELAEVASVEGLCAAVAEACGIVLAASRDEASQVAHLGEALSGLGPVLLLLDNFEQLAPLSAQTVAVWHATAPEAVFVVSTRDRLHLPAEVVHALEPLSVESATELLAERAAAVRRGADQMPDEVAEAIVDKLDRMPLAIELAAARLGLLQPRQLLERLGKRFDLLKTKHRSRSARQATLWGAIDGSWQQLEPDDRVALAAMSRFHGGFTLEAAEAVLEHTGADVLEVVQTLRDRSLLHVYIPDETPDMARLGLYETIRAFAVEQLKADTSAMDAAAAAHREWALACGADLAEAVHGHDGGEARRTLLLERDNLLAALDDALARQHFESAARLALALDPVLATNGPFRRHRQLLDKVLEGTLTAELRARTLLARGQHSRRSGQLADACTDLADALACAQGATAKNLPLEGDILSHLGIATHETGDLETARVHYEQALTIFRDAGDLRREGRALGSLAILHNERGRFEDAQTHYEWALRLLRRVGDVRSEAIFLCNLGDLHHEQGRLTEARRHYEEATKRLETVGDQRVRGVVVGNLGAVLQEQGDFDAALVQCREAVRILTGAGDRRLAAVFEGYAGGVLHEQGLLKESDLAYGTALDALSGSGDRRYEALFLAQRATAAAERGQLALAEPDWDRARALAEELDDALLGRAIETHRGHRDIASGDMHAAEKLGEAAAVDAASSDAVRFAVRRLTAALAQAGGGTAAGAVVEQVPLRVAKDGRGFQVPQGEEVDLSRRRALRLIVATLGERHEEFRGIGMSLDDLLEAGWPGEKVHPEAGANRVYVALATLRKMGLREVLLSRDDGYLLDPDMAVDRY